MFSASITNKFAGQHIHLFKYSFMTGRVFKLYQYVHSIYY